MKRILFFLLLILWLIPAASSQAQGSVTAIDTLNVDLWPDYDRPSVLVLLSGTLPAGTSLPATITIPLPDGAQLNAVAYQDPVNGMMNAEYTTSANELTITVPGVNFRVEYYLPYNVEGSQHSFNFNWVSELAVNQFQAKVQQPISAGSLITEPAATNVVDGGDGFTYYVLPTQVIPAGQPFTINTNYTMATPQLSVDNQETATIDLQPAGPITTTVPTREFNWPLIAAVAGGFLIVAALAFLYLGNRPVSRVRKPKPRPERQIKKSAGRFCHNCGQSVAAGDRFCRHCGTPVKGKS